MKRKLCLMIATVMIACSVSAPAFAVGGSLDDVINNNQTVVETESNSNVGESSGGGSVSSSKSSDFVKGFNSAADVTADIAGANQLTDGIRKASSFVISIILNSIPILLTLRFALDLAYILVPFSRNALANGHTGAAPAAGGQSGGIGGGFGGGGFGGGGFGGGGFGGGGFGGGMSGGMSGQQGQQAGAKVQLVSNAALNAVASEKAVGSNGQAQGPFKIYVKDMAVTALMAGILVMLAATGVLTVLGSVLGSLIVDGIRSIQGMV